MMKTIAGFTAALVLYAASPAAAQDAAPAEQLRVFIDCSFYCDMDFMRTDLTWIDYMRDRADAQVHVLVSPQSTGGGGQRFTLEFIGLRNFAGINDTIVFNTTANDTDDTRRRAMSRNIGIGLVRYVAGTPTAQRLTIGLAQPPRAPGGAAPQAETVQRDPWNYWTFRLGTSGSMDGEKSRESFRVSNSVSANRTTEDWKVNVSVNGSYSEQSFTFFSPSIEKDTTVTSITRNYGINSLIVKSLGSHLSAGITTSLSTSTFGNTELQFSMQPAVEYNVFPYSESTRRQLTARYAAGVRMFDYRDTTVYLEVAETRPIHSLAIAYSTRQPWGSINVGVDGSQYLHNTRLYGADIGGGLSDIRLFKGFSLSMFGNYQLIRNQISLAKGRLTPEQVLLRQRELETGYRYFANIGISYRFGSIFNNVVNPRFGGGGGGIMIMM